jgi:hypothetical protein
LKWMSIPSLFCSASNKDSNVYSTLILACCDWPDHIYQSD